jgi:hypothetical protein
MGGNGIANDRLSAGIPGNAGGLGIEGNEGMTGSGGNGIARARDSVGKAQ